MYSNNFTISLRKLFSENVNEGIENQRTNFIIVL